MTLRLPVAFKCAEGKKVEIKADSHNMAGWLTGCRGRWVSTLTEHEMHVILTEAGEIDQFEIHLETTPDNGLLIHRVHVAGRLWKKQRRDAIPPLTNVVLSSELCSNVWVGDQGDVERDKGKNNNGWALDLDTSFLTVRLWPKREDRIRLDLRGRGGASDQNLEIDTSE